MSFGREGQDEMDLCQCGHPFAEHDDLDGACAIGDCDCAFFRDREEDWDDADPDE